MLGLDVWQSSCLDVAHPTVTADCWQLQLISEYVTAAAHQRVAGALSRKIILIGLNLIVNELERNGYVELENEYSQTYKVVAAFSYLEQLVVSININEDNDDEVSK